MDIVSIINDIGRADATIYIAIAPIYNTLAMLGFTVCLYAAVSRRICTRDRATAAAVHLLLIMWVILMWRDHVNPVPPLLLSLIVRSLIFMVTILLMIPARLNYINYLKRNIPQRSMQTNGKQ